MVLIIQHVYVSQCVVYLPRLFFFEKIVKFCLCCALCSICTANQFYNLFGWYHLFLLVGYSFLMLNVHLPFTSTLRQCNSSCPRRRLKICCDVVHMGPSWMRKMKGPNSVRRTSTRSSSAGQKPSPLSLRGEDPPLLRWMKWINATALTQVIQSNFWPWLRFDMIVMSAFRLVLLHQETARTSLWMTPTSGTSGPKRLTLTWIWSTAEYVLHHK